MRRTAALIIAVLAVTVPGYTQTWATDVPATADGEDWYISGAPLMLDGRLYYPAGAIRHFQANEMVRTGAIGAVPVFALTTYEPGSVVFVPLAGGLVRPYERRRDGELAGTVGSTSPAFPVALPESTMGHWPILRAPGPPTGSTGMWGALRTPKARRLPAGVSPAQPQADDVPGPQPWVLSSARAPEGLNAAFIPFQDERWFLAGRAVPYDAARFERAGQYFGFAVYRNAAEPRTIFVPVVDGAPGLLTPYRAR